MFFQISFSSQVTQWAIITYKHGILRVAASRVAEQLNT